MVRPVHSKRKLFNNNKEQKENEPEGSVRNLGLSNSGHGTSNSYNHNLNNNHSSHNIVAHSTNNLNVRINTSHGKVENSEDVGTTPCTPGRPVMPMSERQQIALLMQMSSPSPSEKSDISRSSSPRTPSTPNLGRGVNKRNERGETPLHVASIKGDTDRVSQLISQGADVNANDYAGWSALHEACNRGFYGVSKLLIEAGADVNAKGLDNDTPLHDACINNHFKLVRLLLKCGAGVDVVNRRGKSPRDVSRSPGIVSLIEQAAKGNLESLGTSSGEDIAPQAKDLYKRMSRRTPPTTKPSDDKPGGPGSPRVTLRLQTGVTRTPDKPRQHDNKSSMDTEDVYEFKCGKDDSKGKDDAEGKGGVTTVKTDEKSEKRARDGELESEEDARTKRRKEDNSKDSTSQPQQQQQQQQQQQGATKGIGRGAGSRPSQAASGGMDKTGKSSNRGSSGGNNSSTGGGNSSTNNNGGNNTNGGNGNSSNINSAGGSLGISAGDKKSPMTSAANSPKPTTTKTGESSDTEDDVKSESSSGAGPKVPPLKIVLGGATEAEQSTRNGKNNVSRLPYVVNTTGEEKDGQSDTKEGISQIEDANNSNSNSSNGSGSEKGSGSRITRSRGGNNASEEDIKPIKTEIKVESPPPPPVAPADIIHPRKRKIKIKEAEMETVKREPASTSATDQPVTNCYETFLKIRKQIERRRESLRPVQPKPPQDFENYLMNRCTYVLAGNASSRLSVPVISPPGTLSQPLKDLFNDQEKERYRLRLQHLIEKEKLVLSVEQEILRVHGRAARALANQALPFSVCTLLKDEEVYNVINPEQEKDGNARSRYNGRLFLSWLQDVDDKWEKIKEHMVLRHHHEAESLHAVQRMDWEWKLKELRLIEHNQRPKIDDVQVPQVQVSDDFDLLPA